MTFAAQTMLVPLDICHIIAEYVVPKKLLDWIPAHKLYWEWLSQNPEALYLLEMNLDKINWHYVSKNPAAVHLLEANPDNIYWYWLSANPAAIHLLKANPVCVANDSLPRFLRNRRRSQGFERGWNPLHPDKIDWCALSRNPATIPMDQKK